MNKKSHYRHTNVAQYAYHQVLQRIHVVYVVVVNMPRHSPSVHDNAVVALPENSSDQDVIAYREIQQSLAVLGGDEISVDALHNTCHEFHLGVQEGNYLLLKPVFVDWADLKTLFVPLDESSKGRPRLMPQRDVVRGFLEPLPLGRVRCPLNGR